MGRAPLSRTTRASAWTSATTPVDVSECTRTATSAPVSARRERRSSGCGVSPQEYLKLVDVRPERRRHRAPAIAERPGRHDEHALAGREDVHERRLERTRPGCGEEQHVVLGPADLLQAAERPEHELAEVGPAVVDHRSRARGENLRGHRGRPRRHEIALPHAASVATWGDGTRTTSAAGRSGDWSSASCRGARPTRTGSAPRSASARHDDGAGPCVASSWAAAASIAPQSASRQVASTPAPQYRREYGPRTSRPRSVRRSLST